MSENPARQNRLIDRLYRAFGPLAGAMVLDVVDLATFGPYGVGGLVIGTLVGWWICSIYAISPVARVVLALLAGIYCLLPLTEWLPVATLVSALGRFKESPRQG